MLINNAVITGSFIVNGVDVTGITGSAAISSSFLALSSSYLATSASYVITSGSYASTSASLSIRTSNLEATSSTLVSASSSFAAQSASLSTRLTTDETNISTLTTASGSFAVVSASFSSTSQSVSSRVTLIEGQYATTGSNNFSGPQYINQASNAIGFASTASLYTNGGLRVTKDAFVSGTAYFNNVVVYGTSSIQYITSSQIFVGASTITLNTQTPAVRFGGMVVYDSGSTALTGSMLWDSQNNKWIYQNASGSAGEATYNSGMIMSGPRNTGALGNEQGTLNNYVTKGQGGDHITSSQIIDDGTTVQIPGNLQVTGSIVGSSTATFGGQVRFGTGLYIDTNGDFYQPFTGQIQISGVAGNTTYPSYGFYGDTGIGMYRESADTLAFVTSGVKALTIASTGAATFASSVTAGGFNGVTYKGSTYEFYVINNAATSNLLHHNASNLYVLGQIYVGGNGFDTGTKLYTSGDNVSFGSGTFSSSVTAGGEIGISGNASVALNSITGYTSQQLQFRNNGTNKFQFYLDTSNNSFNIFNTAQSANNFTISSTGAATFSGNVGINGGSTNFPLVVKVATNQNLRISTETSTAVQAVNDAINAFVTLKVDGSPLLLNSQSGGNVGIGTDSPTREMVLYRSSGEVHFKLANGTTGQGQADGFDMAIDSAGAGYFIQRETQPIIFYTSAAERMSISSGGNVLIGSGTTAQGPLDVFRSVTAGLGGHIILRNNGAAVANETAVLFVDGDISSTRAAISSTTEGAPYFGDIKFKTGASSYASLTTRMMITGAGNQINYGNIFLNQTAVGTVDANATSIGINGIYYMNRGSGSGLSHIIFSNGGNVVGSVSSNTTNTQFNTSSDYRLKKDLKDFDALNVLSNIKLYDFAWKLDNSRMYGVLAHELSEVLPYAVSGEKDGEEMQGVDYSKLVPILTKAIQELSAKVDAQAAEINELKNK